MRALSVVLVAFCACASYARIPRVDPPRALAAKPVANVDAAIVREVHSERVTYVFRASRMANLLYELDCLAGIARCSREVYEADWSAHLGLDDDDRAALRSWSDLHSRYNNGNIVANDSAAPTSLPVFDPMTRGVSSRIRLAGYGANDVAGVLDRIGLFVEPRDVSRAAEVMARFNERFEKVWLAHRKELATKVDGFAALMQRSDVTAIVESVARFYAPDLPAHTQETIELIARPQHDGSDYGEQLGDHALVETVPEEQPAQRLAVVLHELFHRWFASAPYEKKRALADAFAASPDPFARCAYGLMNEALATAFGNGLVARAVDPEDFEKRRAQPLGLYHDRFVDPTVKAILPWIEARLAAGKTLYDADFLPEYLHLVASALPKGVAPLLHLRPLVSVYEASLEDVEQHLYRVVGSNWSESETGFGKDARDLLAKHPTWGTAVVVLASHVDQLKGVDKIIDAAAMATLHREVAKKTPFVLTIAREKAAPLFVFVAADGAAMQELMDRFGELDTTTFGVWRLAHARGGS